MIPHNNSDDTVKYIYLPKKLILSFSFIIIDKHYQLKNKHTIITKNQLLHIYNFNLDIYIYIYLQFYVNITTNNLYIYIYYLLKKIKIIC